MDPTVVTIEYDSLAILAGLYTSLTTVGLVLAIHAVMHTRTAQAAIAWGLCLVTFPLISIPAYLVFGRRRFMGYSEALAEAGERFPVKIEHWLMDMKRHHQPLDPDCAALDSTITRLNGLGFSGYNRSTLLEDGDETYGAMLNAMRNAQSYILIQFFIVRSDDTGEQFADCLVEKAGAGVQVYFLYDEIGCSSLPASYLERLVDSGVTVSGFRTTRGRGNRFQINFRNHRKLLVTDGKTGFIGGLNLGDEYRGLRPGVGHWRDTHMQIDGPATQAIQLSFLKDWYWATRSLPDVDLEAHKTHDEQHQSKVAILGTGPGEGPYDCSVMLLALISQAKRLLWIASPYFVPDTSTTRAIQVAASRGVDVRILLPGKPDHRVVELASINYYNDMFKFGVRLYRYRKGFLHQKVILVDDHLATVGTVNLDNRSIYINFEATAIIDDASFGYEIHQMLRRDIDDSEEIRPGYWEQQSFPRRIASRLAWLAAPLL